MKKINFPLLIGGVLLLVLLLISLFPQKFATKDPNYQYPHRTYNLIENGKESPKVDFPPWGPNEENSMGVDELGRDIYTRIIYGARVTLKTALLIVALRFLLAIPIGIIAGIGSKFASGLIHFFNTVFTALPILFVSFFILNISYINELQVDESIIAFALVLSILGWGKLGKQVEEKANKIMKEEFIEGEIAVGKSKIQIAVQNMMPHLVPSLISIVFIEVGLVIFLLAQLSIFSVFVGPRIHFVRVEGQRGFFVAENPEWGAMLSRIVLNNKLGNYWIGLYPALAFTFGIIAFNLTGEGLRIEFERRTSKVASNIRKIGFVFSPKIYIQQIFRFKEYYKSVMLKTLCIIILITYIMMPPSKSLYPFEVDQAILHIEELIKPEYEGRYSGFEGNHMAGDYIIQQLKEYGLEPYDGESFTQEIISGDQNQIEDSTNLIVHEAYIDLISDDGKILSYEIEKDFVFTSFNYRDIDNEDVLDDDGYIRLSGTSSPDDQIEKFAILSKDDKRINVEEMLNYSAVLRKSLFDQSGLGANISLISIEEEFKMGLPASTSPNYNIIVKGQLAKNIHLNDYEIDIRIKPPTLASHNPRNIFAVLPGADWSNETSSQDKKDIIIIGSSYDGVRNSNGETSAMMTSKTGINLEIARVLSGMDEPLEKTIVFAFWDSTWYRPSGARYYDLKGRIFGQQHYNISYFDVGTVNDKDNINIQIFSPNAFQVETYDLKKDMISWLKKKQYKYGFKPSWNGSFREIGYNMSLKIGVDSGNYTDLGTERDTIENLSQVQMRNMGQFFIDLITMNEYFK